MKKITALLLLLAFFSTAQAQGLYFKAGGGYAVPIASDQIGEKYLTVSTYDGANTTTYDDTKEVVKGSYGAGVNFNVGGGYMFNEFLGVELNFQYTQSKKYETGDVYRYESPTYTQNDKIIAENFSKAFYINPSFIITPGAGTKVPYGRFGIVAAAPTIKGEETTTQTNSYYPPSTGSRKWEYTGGISFGFQGAVGMNWMISDKIDLFTEVNFVSMTYYADQRELTEDIDNGYDNLPDMPEYYKKTIFKDKIDVEGEPSDVSKPREELRDGAAFSSVSFQIGISFLLNGHGEN